MNQKTKRRPGWVSAGVLLEKGGKPNIPPAPKNPQQAARHALLTQLSAEFPLIAEYRPLAIGIHLPMRAPGTSNKLMRRALAFDCGQRRYLKAHTWGARVTRWTALCVRK